MKIEPVKDPQKIINYWKKEKFVVVCIVFFGLSFNISMILGPIYQGKLIDSIAVGGSLPVIIRLAVTFAVLIGTIQLLRYFKRFYIRRFANSTSATMRLMIYNSIMHKSKPEIDNEDAGNLMTRAISDVDMCVEGMRKFTTEVFDTGVLMASYLLSMLFYDVKITIIAGIFIPAAMILAEKLKSVIYKYSLSFRQKSSEISSITYDAVENAMMYRANGVEALNCKLYEEELEDLQNKAIRANILENSMQPVYNVIAMLGVISIIYLGGTNVINGQWTIGIFVTYITMFAALAIKASKAAKLFNSVQKSKVSWIRIRPYLSEYKSKNTAMDASKNAAIKHTENHTGLFVKDLCFTYPTGAGPVLEGISFEAKPGEIVGITGPVASGKSTLGLSLLGLYPYAGSITIDKRELKDYSEYEISRRISYLGHQPELLSGSIYENITLGEKADIASVLKDVCFDEDLKAMPDGLQTIVGTSGIRLSGGQQARIALARTLLKKNEIIILDDPFSAVDMNTEEKIIVNLKDHYKDSIIIIISHRLAIFSKMNRIILLHGDKRVEYGSHSDLMNRSELYAEIFTLQYSEGGESDESDDR